MAKAKAKPPSTDVRLRAAGFKVHARPTGQMATWERKGRVYFETAAVTIADREARGKR